MFPCLVALLPLQHTACNQTASELTASCHVSEKRGGKQCKNKLGFKTTRIGQSLAGKGRTWPPGQSLAALSVQGV